MSNGVITLTGPQRREWAQALLSAFPQPNRLDEVLDFYLDKNRAQLTLADDYDTRIRDVLTAANAQGWLRRLLAGARQANPGNPNLLVLAQGHGLATTIATVDNVPLAAPLSGGALERKIKEANPFLDVVKFRTGLGQMEGRICKIEIEGDGTGTGFLVGTDAVITNYHVMEQVIKGAIAPAKVVLRFDFEKLADDTVAKGTEYRLAANWNIDHSEYSAVDLADPTSGQQEPDHLDYALVRVDGAPANDPIGGATSKDDKAPPRGFIEQPTGTHDFVKTPALFILQHPDGEPLKLALDTESVIAVNQNHARVRYRTNTEAGSSGSPCFDTNWKLVALHHLGDPKWLNPQFNQGIPFTSIVTLIDAHGKGDALGRQ